VLSLSNHTAPIVCVFKLVFLPLLLGGLLSGCVYQGGELSPLKRKLSWFSYLNGDDLRKECGAGKGEKGRFVYNGVYTEQVRTYDLSGGDNPTLVVRVIEPANLAEWKAGELSDLMAPWQGKTSNTVLRDQDARQLKRALASDGVFIPKKEGLELSSDDFYWLVSYCSEGVFHYGAYRWPSEAFKRLAFTKLLEAWDMSGIEFNPPRQVFLGEGHPHGSPVRTKFNLRAESNGLMGVSPLLR
jgi:hypothetical protein